MHSLTLTSRLRADNVTRRSSCCHQRSHPSAKGSSTGPVYGAAGAAAAAVTASCRRSLARCCSLISPYSSRGSSISSNSDRINQSAASSDRHRRNRQHQRLFRCRLSSSENQCQSVGIVVVRRSLAPPEPNQAAAAAAAAADVMMMMMMMLTIS